MVFEFATSDRILFGHGVVSSVGKIAGQMGHRALIVTGSGSVPVDPLLNFLEQGGVMGEVFRVGHEPDIQTITDGLARMHVAECDLVVGFGGGSVLDAGKAIAALATNPGDVLDYLEVIGGGKEIVNPPVKMIAIPTTAGTGTEVTRNAVISSREQRVKVSMRSRMMIPTVAMIDPELTYSMPPSVTASTGMDALTQVIEAYVSNRANPMTDLISREGIQCGARSLAAAYRDGTNQAAREDMALTSLFGGLALANSGLGAVHGFAGPMGGMYNAPHGVLCASLLPYVMKYNVKSVQVNEGMNAVNKRFLEVASLLTGNPQASISDGVTWIENLAMQLAIPRLRDIGVQKENFNQIIDRARISSSMQKNPVRLDEETLLAILSEAY